MNDRNTAPQTKHILKRTRTRGWGWGGGADVGVGWGDRGRETESLTDLLYVDAFP